MRRALPSTVRLLPASSNLLLPSFFACAAFVMAAAYCLLASELAGLSCSWGAWAGEVAPNCQPEVKGGVQTQNKCAGKSSAQGPACCR